MEPSTIEQFFEENKSELESGKAGLARYDAFLRILLGSALTLLGIAVFELFIMSQGNEIFPWMVFWIVPQLASLAIAVHLKFSTPWRELPMELRRDTIFNALIVACLAFFALNLRFLAGGAPVNCMAPGFLIAAAWGAGLYHWRYTRRPKPKLEEMFP